MNYIEGVTKLGDIGVTWEYVGTYRVLWTQRPADLDAVETAGSLNGHYMSYSIV